VVAGNAGPNSPPLYPGADPNVIAVTATDMDDKLFSGANWGRYMTSALARSQSPQPDVRRLERIPGFGMIA
jgi:hypothetical protein